MVTFNKYYLINCFKHPIKYLLFLKAKYLHYWVDKDIRMWSVWEVTDKTRQELLANGWVELRTHTAYEEDGLVQRKWLLLEYMQTNRNSIIQ